MSVWVPVITVVLTVLVVGLLILVSGRNRH